MGDQIGTFESKRWGKVIAYRDAYAYDNSLAVSLVSWDSEMEMNVPLSTLSVHVETSPDLGPNCFYAKDWSENAGLAKEALASGLFKVREDLPPVKTGFVIARVWEIA
jgi:hypothetical protein